MNGVEEAEERIAALQEEIVNLREEVAYLREAIGDHADDRLFDLALEALRTFQKKAFKDLAGDTYRWPYAGEKREFSFADEVFLAFKSEGLNESPYTREFTWAAERICKDLSAAERELLTIVCWPKDRETLTSTELETVVRDGVVLEMVTIARDHDAEVLLD